MADVSKIERYKELYLENVPTAAAAKYSTDEGVYDYECKGLDDFFGLLPQAIRQSVAELKYYCEIAYTASTPLGIVNALLESKGYTTEPVTRESGGSTKFYLIISWASATPARPKS